MTSDSSTATEGGTGTGGGSGNGSSHRSSLPWAQVVRGGGEPDAVAPRSPTASPPSGLTEPPLGVSDQLTVMEPQTPETVTVENHSHVEGSDGGNNENESGVKKSAWNKPLANGVVEGSSTPVMGAASWPALSELSRQIPKSLSFQSESSSSKSTSDGSLTVSQAPVISQAPQKPVKPNTSQHSNQNHTHPVRQRSMKRGGGAGGGGYNRLPPPPPPLPPYPLYTTPYGGFVPAILDSPVRDQAPYAPYNGFVSPRPVAGIGSPSHPVHDQPINRKRNNFGPRPRGDGGPYVNNGPGGRRDHHDREWFGPRSHGGVMPHHGAPPPPPPLRGYVQPAHLGSAPFIAPQSIRPYGAPMGYEMPPPPPLVYVPPFLPHAAPLVDTLSVSILHQIEYYFSDDNLVKDHYLRSNMDEEGWVPIKLIAGFHRVKSLTGDLQMVLSSIKDSAIVEVQGETVRRRNDWRKWVNPPINFAPDSSSQSPYTTTEGSMIETSIQKLSLDESSATEERTIDTGLTDSKKLDNEEVTAGDESTNPNSSTS